VINVISRPPSNETEVTIGAGYGNFNQRQAQFSWSDAIVKDKLSFRLSGAYNARDGFTKNILRNEDANAQESLFGRVDFQGVDTVFFEDANRLKQNPFALVNARVGYEWKTGGVYLYVNNLFDQIIKQLRLQAFSRIWHPMAIAAPLVSKCRQSFRRQSLWAAKIYTQCSTR
jgi:outer membrane receptor protein involved in Fe transport